ncbi:MAG: hypothetical protein AAFZ15_00895 [Bacteroidota bacterium]
MKTYFLFGEIWPAIKEWLPHLVALVTFLVTYYGNRAWEAHKTKQAQMDTAKMYADPLLMETMSFVYRLKEIFENDARFLNRRAPQNEFVQYKFRSTLYRLCAILGWMRAAERDHSGIEVHDRFDHEKINNALSEFESVLSRNKKLNERLGKIRVYFLAEKWELPKEMFDDKRTEKIVREIRKKIMEEISAYNGKVADHNKNKNKADVEPPVVYAYGLPEKEQLELLEKVAKVMITHADLEEVDLTETIKKERRSCIYALSRRECWLYRDWQSAIGDMMLKESRGNARRFEVIGYNQFEDFFLKHLDEKQENNRWLARVSRLFHDLSLKREDVNDARRLQLYMLFLAGVKLVNVLNEVDFGQERVDKNWPDVEQYAREVIMERLGMLEPEKTSPNNLISPKKI